MKTLVLVFHPDMSASRANRPLAAKAETLGDDVTVRYMYDIYPDQKVDVAAEQAALEAADRVVLQFPMYWYSTPALLKQWEDDVLLYGWAYGSTGNALAEPVTPTAARPPTATRSPSCCVRSRRRRTWSR